MTEASPQKGVLVALGENWDKGRHGTRRRLSDDSVFTTLAAYKLAQTGLYHTLIFSTGYTNGKHQVSEADAMANLLAIFPEIPDVRILRETISYDTPTNLTQTRQLIRDEHLEGPITVVAPNGHLERTQRLAHNLNLPITTIATEKVVGIPNKRRRLREVILTPLLRIDPRGRIPGILTRRRQR